VYSFVTVRLGKANGHLLSLNVLFAEHRFEAPSALIFKLLKYRTLIMLLLYTLFLLCLTNSYSLMRDRFFSRSSNVNIFFHTKFQPLLKRVILCNK